MPGPAPKDPAARRRRNATVGKTILPAGGRVGDPPAWPLARAEAEPWASLWATPQAAAWETLGWTRVVARYAVLIEAIWWLRGRVFGEPLVLWDHLSD